MTLENWSENKQVNIFNI